MVFFHLKKPPAIKPGQSTKEENRNHLSSFSRGQIIMQSLDPAHPRIADIATHHLVIPAGSAADHGTGALNVLARGEQAPGKQFCFGQQVHNEAPILRTIVLIICGSLEKSTEPKCTGRLIDLKTMKREKCIKTLSRNLDRLIHKSGLSVREVAEKAGVSSRQISYILKHERTPTIEMVEKIAQVFKLSGWQLMLPNLDTALAFNGRLNKLIDDFAHSSPEGRDYIIHVAEKEAGYAVTISTKTPPEKETG